MSLTPQERAIDRIINGGSVASILDEYEQAVTVDLIAAVRALRPFVWYLGAKSDGDPEMRERVSQALEVADAALAEAGVRA